MQAIPFITWPFFAEQKMNAVLLAEDLKVALRPKANEKGLVVGEGGKKVHKHIKDLKIATEKALSVDGSSTRALSALASQWKNQPSF